MPEDLGRPGAEEHPRDRPEVAGSDHQYVTGIPADVLDRLGPGRAGPDHRLDGARLLGQVLHLRERGGHGLVQLGPPLVHHQIFGVGAQPGRVRRPGPHGERRDPQRCAQVSADRGGREYQVFGAFCAAEGRGHPRHGLVARTPESPRCQGERDMRAVQEPVRHTAERDVTEHAGRRRTEHDQPGVVLFGDLEQTGRRGPRAVPDVRRRRVTRQEAPGPLEGLVRALRKVVLVLGVHARQPRHPRRRHDAADNQIVVRRSGQHGRQMQGRVAALVGAVADDHRHGCGPSSSWISPTCSCRPRCECLKP